MIKRIKITLTEPQMMHLFMMAQWSAEDPGEHDKIAKYSDDLYKLIKQLPPNKHTFYLTPDEAFTASSIASCESDWGLDAHSRNLAENVYWRVRKAMEKEGIDYTEFLRNFYEMEEGWNPLEKKEEA